VITPLDESFTHQIVAPRVRTAYEDPRWAERCYHLLFCDEELMLCLGRQLYPFGGRRFAFVGAASRREQISLRFEEPYSLGDDPDAPRVGPLVIEPRRPLHEWRLLLDEPSCPLGLDLEFEARFPPRASQRNRIELGGEVVTDYMNFFQSGRYRGLVAICGRERRIEERLGFRDRGWGLRRHEGSPARGLVVFCACELADAAIYVLLYETASGRRVLTNGWVQTAAGHTLVRTCRHDLLFEEALLEGGSLEVELDDGARRRLEFEVRNRLYLSGVGYSRERKGPGVEHFDVSDPSVRARLNGQNDNGCLFHVDGVSGHGFVETGLGVHARYRPEDGSGRD